MNKHQFVRVSDIDKPAKGVSTIKMPGATIVCAFCGQTKDVYADGIIDMRTAGNGACDDSK